MQPRRQVARQVAEDRERQRAAHASAPRTRSGIGSVAVRAGPASTHARIAPVTVAGRPAGSAGGTLRAVMAVQAGSRMTAYHEHTTPAGATPPLPLACGTVRTIEPVSAGRWLMPLGQGALTYPT